METGTVSRRKRHNSSVLGLIIWPSERLKLRARSSLISQCHQPRDYIDRLAFQLSIQFSQQQRKPALPPLIYRWIAWFRGDETPSLRFDLSSGNEISIDLEKRRRFCVKVCPLQLLITYVFVFLSLFLRVIQQEYNLFYVSTIDPPSSMLIARYEVSYEIIYLHNAIRFPYRGELKKKK